MATSPTQRTLAKLRAEGYLAEVTERWVPGAKIRKDLFGFGDVIAVRQGEVLFVQATSRDHVAARVQKIANSLNVARVREANVRIEVHGWAKMASGRWECRVVDCS